jgi:hypothetical protein
MSVPLLAAIAFLPQGQTAKKVMMSSCNKAHKDKTLTTSCNIHEHAFRSQLYGFWAQGCEHKLFNIAAS